MKSVLIANRGEIALRIQRACRTLGKKAIAVYSTADRHARHVREADAAVCIGPAEVEASYLNIQALLDAAAQTGADAVHPGYGFLAENAGFAEAVIEAGLTWIGPSPDSMLAMASKIEARSIAMAAGVPVLPGRSISAEAAIDIEQLITQVGLPLLVKASAGGGGIGMREVHERHELEACIAEARAQGQRQFGSGDLLLEKLLLNARHVEVQIAGDQHGNIVHFFDRDCSCQRRRQKLLEEAPAPGLSTELRSAIHQSAISLARAVDYHSVGTVEFLVTDEEHFLLEMNTRLQVEHPVTEAICEVDLAALQIRIADGEALPVSQEDIGEQGHAIEARIYAESPGQGFLPDSGAILRYREPDIDGIRIDSGIDSGSSVEPFYDGLMCKLIAHADNREAASARLAEAMSALQLMGVNSNQALLAAVLRSDSWASGMNTGDLERQIDAFFESSLPTDFIQRCALAVATIHDFLQHPPAADRQPWRGGYQLARRSSWLVQGQVTEVDWRWLAADTFEFPVFDIHARLLEFSAEQMILEIGGQRHAFEVTNAGGDTWLWHPGLGNLRLQRAQGSVDTASQRDNNSLLSLGPGQILKVLVAVGDKLEAGEAVLVLESMKMESTLAAPASGTVTEIHVAEGDLIASHQLLLKVEAETAV